MAAITKAECLRAVQLATPEDFKKFRDIGMMHTFFSATQEWSMVDEVAAEMRRLIRQILKRDKRSPGGRKGKSR